MVSNVDTAALLIEADNDGGGIVPDVDLSTALALLAILIAAWDLHLNRLSKFKKNPQALPGVSVKKKRQMFSLLNGTFFKKNFLGSNLLLVEKKLANIGTPIKKAIVEPDMARFIKKAFINNIGCISARARFSIFKKSSMTSITCYANLHFKKSRRYTEFGILKLLQKSPRLAE
jgi:hypothetical protein